MSKIDWTGSLLHTCRLRRGAWVLALAFGLAPACRGREPDPPAEVGTRTTTPGAAPTPKVPSPEVPPDPELLDDSTRLAGNHILITYKGSKLYPSHLALPPEISQRSREEALALAGALAAKAKAAPASFAELARTQSEDVFTARYGGSFGVVGLAGLPQEVGAALLAMREGEVSGPIESPIGFHILMRTPLPKDIQLSGRSLLITYAGAPETAVDDPASITRTRAQARALATTLWAQAKKKPESFPELIRKHSDGLRALDGGYLGVWMLVNGKRDPHLSLPLLSLTEGQISEVLETPFGFQIFQRLTPVEPETLAASAIVVPYRTPGDPADDAPSLTRAEASTRIRTVREQLTADPTRFAELARQYPMSEDNTEGKLDPWQQGDQDDAIELAVLKLDVGGISPPLEVHHRFVILRRDAPPPH
jgi:parvulin-like peptidyl-prolyl isomerase